MSDENPEISRPISVPTTEVPLITDGNPQEIADRMRLWNEAVAAAIAGDKTTAEWMYRIFNSLRTEKKVNPLKRKPSVEGVLQTQTATNESRKKKGDVIEGGLLFRVGAVTKHTNIGYPRCFDENIRALRNPLPLTLFNEAWQERAMTYFGTYERFEDEDCRYLGVGYRGEWTQTFMTWTLNYRYFIETLRDVYGFESFSKSVEKHKQYVDKLHDRYGFMVAFRYDLDVRANAFSNRVNEEQVPDISLPRSDIFDLAFNKVRRFEEFCFADNPYAKGGERSSYDPITFTLKR